MGKTRLKPGPLPKAKRVALAHRALQMSVKGESLIDIGKALEIDRHFAGRLVAEELANRSEHRSKSDDREKAIAHYIELIRTGWSGYNQCNPATNAAIGYLHSIRAAQERIDKLTGAEAPMKFEDVTDSEVVWDDADDYLSDGFALEAQAALPAASGPERGP